MVSRHTKVRVTYNKTTLQKRLWAVLLNKYGKGSSYIILYYSKLISMHESAFCGISRYLYHYIRSKLFAYPPPPLQLVDMLRRGALLLPTGHRENTNILCLTS